MLNKLIGFIRRHDLIMPGDSVVCAVSGGADSVALLFALWLLREKLDFSLSAAHFDHGLRGEESRQDARFVERLCGQYDIPLHMGAGQVVAGKKGLEAAARDARYAFLQSLPGKIATAHTADDNAETVLLHLVRGTGLKGLGGIAPVRGNLIRPMLEITRAEVLAFLAEYHLSYREDSSNDTDQFLRNRLRHHVMPLLREENPRIGEGMSRMALRLRQDEDLLTELSQYAPPLQVEELKTMHPARQARVLEKFLKDSGVKEPEAQHIAMAQALLYSKKPSASARFPGGVTIARCYGVLRAQTDMSVTECRTLPCPGELMLEELGLRVICEKAENVINTPEVFTVDIQGTVTLRSRRPGDRIRLSGGTKTMKKLFIDRKIPAHSRERIPVLCDELGVLGVYGIGADIDRVAPMWQIRFISIENGGT